MLGIKKKDKPIIKCNRIINEVKLKRKTKAFQEHGKHTDRQMCNFLDAIGAALEEKVTRSHVRLIFNYACKIAEWVIKLLASSYMIYLIIPFAKELPELGFTDVLFAIVLPISILSSLFSHVIRILQPKQISVERHSLLSDNNIYTPYAGAKGYYKIKAVHEAGHAVVANYFGFSVKTVSIKNIGGSGGRTIIPQFGILSTADDLWKEVIILYAGYHAERLLLGDPSDGCIGNIGKNDNDVAADVESANRILKKYIVLTDDSISLTGTDREIEFKMEELSKKISKETETLVRKLESSIRIVAEQLKEKKEIDGTIVNDIVIGSILERRRLFSETDIDEALQNLPRWY